MKGINTMIESFPNSSYYTSAIPIVHIHTQISVQSTIEYDTHTQGLRNYDVEVYFLNKILKQKQSYFFNKRETEKTIFVHNSSRHVRSVFSHCLSLFSYGVFTRRNLKINGCFIRSRDLHWSRMCRAFNLGKIYKLKIIYICLLIMVYHFRTCHSQDPCKSSGRTHRGRNQHRLLEHKNIDSK